MRNQRGIGMVALLLMAVVLIGLVLLGVYLVKLDNRVRERFEGRRWDIPAKVYARPLELTANAEITSQDVLDELRLLNYHSASDYQQPGTYSGNDGRLFIHTRGFDFGDSREPERVIELTFNDQAIESIRTTAPSANGVLRLEPLLIGSIFPQHNEDRLLIKLSAVPQPLINALIATEDRNFYHHYGVSIRGLARAVMSNITGGKRQGGSTLTQQLVKNFYLNPERTYKRKANEALMALLLEMHYSKGEILETYLNEVNLGQNGNYSVNGYGLASQFYYGRPLRELKIAEQAFLVGLVNGPSYYNPWKYPDRALARRNIVLRNMLITGSLTQDQYEREKARPLGILKKPGVTAARFPDFMDLVRRQLRQDYNADDLNRQQGLRIFSTLDPLAQTRIEASVNRTVNQLVNQNPRRLKGLQGAVIVAHPQSGEIVAALGSTSRFTGFNRVLDAKRQVGSLLKPVIYMQSLQGGNYNWASPIDDSAIDIKSVGQKAWTPKNYGGGEHGMTDLQTALANSYNLAAVRLGWEAGLPTFINNLKRLGVTSPIPNYPSILLGAVNMAPIEVLSIYQNFANGGLQQPARAIRTIVDSSGHPLMRANAQLGPAQTMPASTAYLVNYGLQHVIETGTGRAAAAAFPGLKLAGKSGTTNDERDSWFAGYSGNYLAVVWLGQDDNRAIGLTGSSGALPVWINAMRQLHHTPNALQQPSDIQWQWMDGEADLLSWQGCAGAVYIPMLAHTVPRGATECGQPHYQIDTTLTQDPLSEMGVVTDSGNTSSTDIQPVPELTERPTEAGNSPATDVQPPRPRPQIQPSAEPSYTDPAMAEPPTRVISQGRYDAGNATGH